MTANYSSEIQITIFQPFQNAKVTNKDRRQIAAESRQTLCVLTAYMYTPRLLDRSSPNLYTMSPDYCHLMF